MQQGLDNRLRGSARGHFLEEFLTNSAHFPLANIFLELLLEGGPGYLLEPDLYVIALASVVQAWVSAGWRYAGHPKPLLGNLIGPAVYSAIEFALEGPAFFAKPHHIAYWGFALAIGVLQQLRLIAPERLASLLLLLEHVTRTSILLVMYVLLEALTSGYSSAGDFLADSSHTFIAIVIPLLGVIIGFGAVTAQGYLRVLRDTADQLKKYSEWLLGRDLLSRAVMNPEALQLARRDRGVLFMDIRGFTQWSDTRSPEQVVAMVNAFYARCEQVWMATEPVKIKLTADELMAVYGTADEAVACAMALRAALTDTLAPYGLGVGIGVHCGPLMEGLVGGGALMSYDVLGDTVNTAKRICDQAAAGEILLSPDSHRVTWKRFQVGAPREVHMKGKPALLLYPLTDTSAYAGH